MILRTHSILEECSTKRDILKISRKLAHNVQEHNALKPSDPIPFILIALEGSSVYTLILLHLYQIIIFLTTDERH